jgi:hypothetical protein
MIDADADDAEGDAVQRGRVGQSRSGRPEQVRTSLRSTWRARRLNAASCPRSLDLAELPLVMAAEFPMAA